MGVYQAYAIVCHVITILHRIITVAKLVRYFKNIDVIMPPHRFMSYRHFTRCAISCHDGQCWYSQSDRRVSDEYRRLRQAGAGHCS
jgi:hypothetical protein